MHGLAVCQYGFEQMILYPFFFAANKVNPNKREEENHRQTLQKQNMYK